MAEEVPLKPLGKEDVRKLELALIFGTLFRPDVVERIHKAEDRLTWLDSLVVAAGALARERAGYPVSRIAEELGRSETTIRNHLGGKTEAGRLVKETYELLRRSGGRLEIQLPTGIAPQQLRELEECRSKLSELERAKSELEKRVSELEAKLSDVKKRLEEIARSI